jgi:RNase P/RNase MRP subunit POP5
MRDTWRRPLAGSYFTNFNSNIFFITAETIDLDKPVQRQLSWLPLLGRAVSQVLSTLGPRTAECTFVAFAPRLPACLVAPTAFRSMVRFRNRYLLCTVEYAHGGDEALSQLSSRAIHSAVKSSIERNFGDVGAGHATPVLSVKLWSAPLSLAIIRASRDHFTTVWSAITLLTVLPPGKPDNPVRITVIHVGATIRACQKNAADHAERVIQDYRRLNMPVDRLISAAAVANQELTDIDPTVS